MCPTSGITTVLIIQSVMLADYLINYYKIITYVELKSLTRRQDIPGTAGRSYLLTVELKSLTTPSWAGPTDQHMSGRIHPTLHIVHRLWRRLRQLITSSPHYMDSRPPRVARLHDQRKEVRASSASDHHLPRGSDRSPEHDSGPAPRPCRQSSHNARGWYFRIKWLGAS